MIALTSTAVGTVVSLFVGRLPVKPASDLIYGMNSLAAGNYEARLLQREDLPEEKRREYLEIPETERTRIFQKFYQCDSSHTAQGNGIGLAIVSRIVALHEGNVR